MPVKILISFLLIYSSLAFSRGDEVGNGAGYIENRVTYIFQSSIFFINKQLNNLSFTEQERKTLGKIVQNKENILRDTKLIFLPQDNTFFIDNEFRIAYTGSHIGSNIYFNLDILYNQIESKNLNKVILSVLIHELGHLVGEADHFFLDKLGNKVAKASIDETLLYHFGNLENLNFFEVTKFMDTEKSDLITLHMNNNSYELNDLIESKSHCPGVFRGMNFYQDLETKELFGILLIDCSTSDSSTKLESIQIHFDSKSNAQGMPRIVFLN